MDTHVFRAVESAIEEALKGAKGRNPLDHANLNLALSTIIKSYCDDGLDTEDATSLDFSDATYRWAYAYLYLTSHTHMVMDTLRNFWKSSTKLHAWHNTLSGRQVRVCCVGGGPGSDLLGVCLFLRKQRLRISGIGGVVLDQWKKWEETYHSVANQLDPARFVLPKNQNVTYQTFQFNQEPLQTVEAIQKADLVTMVKFISAASADRELCQHRLSSLLQHMKEGAMLFVLDNAGGGYTELVSRAAEKAGLDKIIHFSHKEMELDDLQRDKMRISRLRFALAMHPQTSCKVSASLWQKGSALKTNLFRCYPHLFQKGIALTYAHEHCSSMSARQQSLDEVNKFQFHPNFPSSFNVPPRNSSQAMSPVLGKHANGCNSTASPPQQKAWKFPQQPESPIKAFYQSRHCLDHCKELPFKCHNVSLEFPPLPTDEPKTPPWDFPSLDPKLETFKAFECQSQVGKAAYKIAQNNNSKSFKTAISTAADRATGFITVADAMNQRNCKRSSIPDLLRHSEQDYITCNSTKGNTHTTTPMTSLMKCHKQCKDSNKNVVSLLKWIFVALIIHHIWQLGHPWLW